MGLSSLIGPRLICTRYGPYNFFYLGKGPNLFSLHTLPPSFYSVHLSSTYLIVDLLTRGDCLDDTNYVTQILVSLTGSILYSSSVIPASGRPSSLSSRGRVESTVTTDIFG